MSKRPQSKNTDCHIGTHIREQVIPVGMSVTTASKLLGVGRPALSNLLNGNASLSPEMAQKLERTFDVNAEELLGVQASMSATTSAAKGKAETSKVFVPVFMNVTSRDIEDWGKDRIKTRSRLAVFIRRLINSTVDNVIEIDFPANDDSQRPGWDGYTVTQIGNNWVPSGKVGWEFGTNKEPKPKADKDYIKSLNLPSDERQQTTFVFVTTMRWHGKKAWVDERRAENQWKDVKAYDASDLEQWIEQSISAQVWFSNETNVASKGTLTLDAHWKSWSADCSPPLAHSLFSEALGGGTPKRLKKKLHDNDSITITADSSSEGLAFLSAAFHLNEEMHSVRDRMVIFTETGVLPGLIARNVGVIPVVASPAVEQELAPLKGTVPSVVVQHKNIRSLDPDFSISTLSVKAFNAGLSEMGLKSDEIDRLSRTSGRSITILRRKLSSTAAISIPNWSSNTRFARFLIPIALAGAWDSRSQADKDILMMLKGVNDYNNIERELLELRDLEDSPVWTVGKYRGVVSKMDALFAICNQVTPAELERFLEIAELVLSEDDPALDLPEGERWLAGIRDKKREISTPLREGISETLVLLAVYSSELFEDRLGFNPADRVTLLVRRLLSPLTGRLLEAQSNDLPMYAEAAPDELLTILEEDLSRTQPAVFDVIRPAGTGLWDTNPRTGLLWALENTAWAPERLSRVVNILAHLSERKLDDNWVNKPINSLGSLFRCWLPQTSAPIEGRIAALEHLVTQNPKVAWPICLAQFEPKSSSASPNHRPSWRPDARGAGNGVPRTEIYEMSRRALDLALGWTKHDEKTLGDLVQCVSSFHEDDQQTVWELIDSWSQSASEEEKAKLREVIRRYTMTKRALRHSKKDGEPQQNARMLRAAKRAYNALQPKDIVQQHAWLFVNNWVELSADELHGDEEAIGEAREVRIEKARAKAVKDVFASERYDGLIRLAHVGDGGFQVGWFTAQALETAETSLVLIQKTLKTDQMTDSQQERNLLSGLMHGAMKFGGLSGLFKAMKVGLDHDALQKMALLAPFGRQTWDFVNSLGDDASKYYWQNVHAGFIREQDDDLNYAVGQLLEAGRPLATFGLIRFQQAAVPPKTIYRALNDATTSPEDLRSYRLDSYTVKEAFKYLNDSGEISVDDMASLEFKYLALFEREDTAIPNLERQINDNPEMFAHAIAFAFKRSDDQDDPVELQAPDKDWATNRAEQAYRLLDRLKKIPGRNETGELDAELLLSWIVSVRSFLKKWARADIGDSQLGQLLAKAPLGLDDIWPCEPVRDAMEKVLNKDISRGFMIGKINLRGVHWRDVGGNQERKQAAQFNQWADATSYQYPKVAKVLREIRDSYLADAKREDTEANIRKRLTPN
ncbi:helix-turn-helix domain-containing protein [Pseudovibrio sp. POLY-S9]|uniref:helix-turn-helix transcriptional regulator n=1 Tax=Pseudovibrio sp. POLY-S9 TaxID=1576596 RepID=UPI00070A0306|nr:helix-turn-helix domain-containing protein [Pseudovibrio sp. POLY-S9]